MTGADITFGLSRLDSQALLDHGFKLDEVRQLAEVGYISAVLRSTGGNQCAAARVLGVHRNTLWRTMKDLGLSTERSAWR